MNPSRKHPALALSWAALALCAAGGCGQDHGGLSATGQAAVATEAVWFRDGRGTVTTPAFSTAVANDLLLAFVASDGPSGGGQTATVSGAGITWTLVARANSQPGTSEIWRATAATPLSGATVQSVLSRTGYDQSLTVVVLSGATGTGSVAIRSAASGAASVTLTSSAAGSWVLAVGNDWDRATARTLGATQTLVHEWVDTGAGDDFWVQRLTGQTTAAGASVVMSTTAPTGSHWNLAAVEVLAAGSGPAPTPTPTFSPAPGSYATGLVVTLADVAANATIHYTTDGSSPTTTSAAYTAPLVLTTTTTIRALATAPGLPPSGVVAAQYLIQGGAASINEHGVILDAGSKLLSWLPQGSAYARIVDRVWNGFLHTIPTQPSTGLKLYYLYPYVAPGNYATPSWPHSPAGTYAMLTDSALLSYPMSGDAALMAAIRDVLAYHLAHGMTTPGDSWASVPYAESDPGATTYRGAGGFGSGIGDGAGVLEPDKVAELGHAWLRFYEFDGTVAFRDAAIQCANQLVAHRRVTTSASLSPWPFRAQASSGAVVEAYTAHVLPAIRLFDELIRLGLGSTASYQVARDAAWSWLMANPMQNNVWTQYFEDVGVQGSYSSNRNQYIPGNTARYLLEHPEQDPQWLAHVQGILAWIETTFGKAAVYGATPIGEQLVYNYPMGSHTSRYGAVNALLYERTGDPAAREKAYRALNWASYLNRSDGITVDGYPTPYQVWFTDSFGDYARHFMIAMGAVPEWAPPGEDHLLRSTSVVQSVAYASGRVDYRTFDGSAQEVLRLSFVPQAVLADGVALPQRADLAQQGWTFDPALGVLRVRHDAASAVAVLSVAPAVTISPAALAVPPRGTAQLTASGGSGSGYAWSLAVNASGGFIDPGTGAYQAGAVGGVADVVRVRDSAGTSATATVFIRLQGNSPASDFDGDGKADLLWRNASTGAVYAWLATGSSGTIFQPAYVTTQAADWQIVGIGDFNGDGKTDLLWRDMNPAGSGRVYVWVANGAPGTVAFQSRYVTTQTADWQVAGIGDFDGDGKSDILWRSASTGIFYVWLATGTSGATYQPRYLTTQTTDWQVAEIGDFNGDGKSDILWRSTSSGAVYVYAATGAPGTATFQPGYLTTQTADWQIVGIGDLDGDGKSDILWRSTSGGQVYAYVATGTSGTTFQPAYVTTQAADWQIVGIGDYDGDGRSDLVWRSSSTGLVYVWRATGSPGAPSFQPGYLTTQWADWQIVR